MIRGVAFLTPSHERLGVCATLNLVSRNRDAASSLQLELIPAFLMLFAMRVPKRKTYLPGRILANCLLITRLSVIFL